jgi:hypothetical protein
MRRSNGRKSTTQSRAAYCSTSTADMTKAGIALLGGAALGAGLLYLLDSEKGAQRRRHLTRGASNLGHSLAEGAGSLASSAADYAGSAWSGLRNLTGSAGDYASDAGDYARDTARSTGGFFSDKYNRARAVFNKDLMVEDRSHHRTELTLYSLGSMVLGATLMYLLDPVMGRARRGQMTSYARSAGDTVTSAGQSVAGYARSAGESVGDYTRKAGQAVRSGANYVSDGVKNMTGMGAKESSAGGTSVPRDTVTPDMPATIGELRGTVCPPGTEASTAYGTTSAPQM